MLPPPFHVTPNAAVFTPHADLTDFPEDGTALGSTLQEPATPEIAPVVSAVRVESVLSALDLTIERLEAHDNLQWKGRLISELSDAELAAAVKGVDAAAPPPPPESRSRGDWLKLRVQWPQRRVYVKMRVDELVADWFQREGPGFQGRINAVLRAYVDARIEAEQRKR